MPYFSFTTLTSTGFGEILPVDPFARSMANLESVVGQLYLAILLARLATMHVESPR
jgi:Ion channel